MWLFRYEDGQFRLKWCIEGSDRPEYAILSHRWREPGEVLLETCRTCMTCRFPNPLEQAKSQLSAK